MYQLCHELIWLGILIIYACTVRTNCTLWKLQNSVPLITNAISTPVHVARDTCTHGYKAVYSLGQSLLRSSHWCGWFRVVLRLFLLRRQRHGILGCFLLWLLLIQESSCSVQGCEYWVSGVNGLPLLLFSSSSSSQSSQTLIHIFNLELENRRHVHNNIYNLVTVQWTYMLYWLTIIYY